MEPTLAEKVSVLQRELNLPAGATLNEKVEKALETLGLADELRELPLVRKVDAALQTLGVTPQTCVQMGAPVPMGAPVSMVTPVAMATPLAQAQAHVVSSPPIAGTIVQPVQAVMPGGSIPASWLDGCWLCCCFPLGPGFYCSKATGADTKMDTVFWLFLPIVPLPDARERIPGTNNFRGGDPSSVDYYTSSRCLADASPFPSCGFRIC